MQPIMICRPCAESIFHPLCSILNPINWFHHYTINFIQFQCLVNFTSSSQTSILPVKLQHHSTLMTHCQHPSLPIPSRPPQETMLILSNNTPEPQKLQHWLLTSIWTYTETYQSSQNFTLSGTQIVHQRFTVVTILPICHLHYVYSVSHTWLFSFVL